MPAFREQAQVPRTDTKEKLPERGQNPTGAKCPESQGKKEFQGGEKSQQQATSQSVKVRTEGAHKNRTSAHLGYSGFDGQRGLEVTLQWVTGQ